MQVGNSGMFRPEMLRPMGLPEDVSVIAWGLSLVSGKICAGSWMELSLDVVKTPPAVKIGPVWRLL